MLAGIFNRIEPGKLDQNFINDDFPSSNFDVIGCVTNEIDLSHPPKYDPKGTLINVRASRIVGLKYQEEPIEPAQKFVVATNNYRAGGGGNFPDIDGKVTVLTASDTNRDVIVRYIIQAGTIAPSADRNWSFAPVAGASALFRSGPKAKDHLGEVKGIEHACEGENGFATFRIKL